MASKKWTEAEELSLCIQTLKQLEASGIKLPFDKISIVGRTEKALGHRWQKLSDLELWTPQVTAATGGGGVTVSAPAAQSSSRSALPTRRNRAERSTDTTTFVQAERLTIYGGYFTVSPHTRKRTWPDAVVQTANDINDAVIINGNDDEDNNDDGDHNDEDRNIEDHDGDEGERGDDDEDDDSDGPSSK
ncbi:hypothetical protein F4777DRAFT_599398 [Nemania sp. FL0916]|nr:hypothetical protein F4777DRAFT_599398 [Nemania sp. FL0916]